MKGLTIGPFPGGWGGWLEKRGTFDEKKPEPGPARAGDWHVAGTNSINGTRQEPHKPTIRVQPVMTRTLILASNATRNAFSELLYSV